MRRKKTHSIRHWGVKTFFVCVAIAGLPLLPYSAKRLSPKLMKIRQLKVMGLSAILPTDFVSLLDVKLGDPLLGKWLKSAVQKVSQNPRVADVAVTRNMTGEVRVNVTERKPTALLNFDRLYFVDDAGNVLGPAQVSSNEGADLPVITGTWKGKSFPPDLRAILERSAELRAAYIKAGYPAASLSELHYDPKKGWILYRTESTTSIVLGERDFEKKFTRLSRVLRDFQGRERMLVEVDLDFGDRAIVKTAGDQPYRGSSHGKEG